MTACTLNSAASRQSRHYPRQWHGLLLTLLKSLLSCALLALTRLAELLMQQRYATGCCSKAGLHSCQHPRGLTCRLSPLSLFYVPLRCHLLVHAPVSLPAATSPGTLHCHRSRPLQHQQGNLMGCSKGVLHNAWTPICTHAGHHRLAHQDSAEDDCRACLTLCPTPAKQHSCH